MLRERVRERVGVAVREHERVRRLQFADQGIGDARQRIREDHLRILRYYRFQARFGSELDDAAEDACAELAPTMKGLSRERVAMELLAILALPDPAPTIARMRTRGVLPVILPEAGASQVAALERLTATAGDGTVSAQGYVSLAEASGYPMNVEVALDDARLARSDALSATATGNLRLAKAAGQTALLSGEITLPETRYEIIRQGSAQVPELTGVRFKPPRGPKRITGDEPAEPQPGLFDQLRLDIALNAPERLYVSGMGLESEWRADMRLGGTSNAPRISGDVELVRGTLGFAGRSFELSDGRVDFTGGTSIDPVIRLTATEDIEDVTVNVNITGRAYDPQIAFSSVPGLPQDEILSRILFGSSIGNLSTIQAVQLAASLNSLRGSGGGLNPLVKLRSATGVDRLRILGPDDTSGRGTALAAGQYLTDDIYVEFITDARGFTATQLEVSLTPFLSILSQAGGSGATNVNIRYRKNY